MRKEAYERIFACIQKTRYGVKIINGISTAITYVTAVLYFSVLFWLVWQESYCDACVTIAVPAVSFILVSVFRAKLNARRPYAGSVSIGKDNQLFEQPQVINDYAAFDREVKKLAKIVNREAAKITKNGAKFLFINYPRKDVGAKQYLPSYYPDSTKDYQRYIRILRKELSDDVIFIDANELFQKYDGDGLL